MENHISDSCSFVTNLVYSAGAQQYTVSRSELHELLSSQLPPESVHLGKRVFSYHQDEENVMIKFMDGTKYYGHVIVGADGAYSVVREHLFLYLSMKDRMKTSEDAIEPFSSVCLVGQTEILDPNEFPSLNSEFSETATIQGSSNLCTVRSILQPLPPKKVVCLDNVAITTFLLLIVANFRHKEKHGLLDGEPRPNQAAMQRR